jgi:hypothetical protein
VLVVLTPKGGQSLVPSSYADAAGVTRWVPFNGLGLRAMEIFKLIPTAGAKETALYFKKQSSLSRAQAEAAMLTALAGDFDEYSRVSIYDPTDLERWWRETVLTPEGAHAWTGTILYDSRRPLAAAQCPRVVAVSAAGTSMSRMRNTGAASLSELADSTRRRRLDPRLPARSSSRTARGEVAHPVPVS